MNARRTRAGLAALLAVSATLAAAATASAANKPFSLVISPQSPALVPGGETVTLTATIHNENTTQQMGSGDLLSPAGFHVTSASIVAPGAGSATPNSRCSALGQTGPCVELRGLSLAAGATVTATMTVQTPICVPPGASFTWLMEAKQANNFSGTPGNDLTLDPATSSPTTTLDGACKLAFVTEPHNVVINEHITGTDWDPTGPAVTVEVLDVSGNVVSGSTAPITVALASNPGAATLGGTPTQSASSGVASFGDLTVNEPAGGYTLGASSGSLTPTTSTIFTAATIKTLCPAGVACSSDLGTADGDGQVFASAGPAGLLLESANANQDTQLNCSGYTSADANTYDFLTTVDRSKTLTITIKQPSTPLHGSATQILRAQQLCFGAPYEFTTSSGTPAPAGTLPDGSPGFVGLLPNCPATLPNSAAPGPCHDRKSDTTILDPTRKLGFDIVLVADIPLGLSGDPWCR
jgi:hypothetical protein